MKSEYYIKLNDGQVVPVNQEVYRAYMRPKWREVKRKAGRDKNEFSLEHMDEKGMGYLCVCEQKLVEDIIEDKLLLEMLVEALETLTEDERFLIDELYFNNKTERDVVIETKRAKTTIHDTKERILKKLLNFFEN